MLFRHSILYRFLIFLYCLQGEALLFCHNSFLLIFNSGQGLSLWLSWLRNCLQCRRPGFDPWVGKIHWREWLPTPVFCLENSMDCIVHGVAKSQTQLSDFHFQFTFNSRQMWEIVSYSIINGRYIYSPLSKICILLAHPKWGLSSEIQPYACAHITLLSVC